MKPKLLTSVLLFVSGYSPLFVIFAVKDFDFDNYSFHHPKAVTALISIAVLSILLLFAIMRRFRTGDILVEVTVVRNRSIDIINYTIPYMISFFGIDLSKPADVIAVTIFLLILLLLTVTSKAVFINPALAIAGYQFYDVEYRFDGKEYSTVVISDEEPSRGHKYRFLALSRYLYFLTEEEGGFPDNAS